MPNLVNLAFENFLSQLGDEMIFGQVWIRRVGSGFELRHFGDRHRAGEDLGNVGLDEMRNLAQWTSSRAFRPLRSAPNLQAGWRLAIETERDLDAALRHLYPGAVADWYSIQSSEPPVTNYREFTDRQSGMYRITQKLSDVQVAETVRACCDPTLCLKRRLWTIQGLETDSPKEKSAIPCLEPCALFLEFARKVTRIEQEEKSAFELAHSDLASAVEAIEMALPHAKGDEQVADMNAPLNSRRLRRLLARLKASLAKASPIRRATDEIEN